MRRVRVSTPGVVGRARTLLWLVLMRVTRLLGRRGYYRVGSWARRYGDRVRIRVAPDTEIIVPLGDIYWTTLLEVDYEPEIAAVLERSLTGSTYFLDCGANIGYWSMLVRNRVRSVVAVEASPATFARLQDNTRLNHAEADVTLLNAAVWNRSGETLTIREHAVHHAAATVTGEAIGFEGGAGWHEAAVPSVTIADLLRDHCPDESAPVILKLDVEGAEREALEGAGPLLLSRDVLVLYEDHGNDPGCAVTRYLHEIGLVTADPRTGRTLEVEDVAAMKTDSGIGYNFVAFRPPTAA